MNDRYYAVELRRDVTQLALVYVCAPSRDEAGTLAREVIEDDDWEPGPEDLWESPTGVRVLNEATREEWEIHTLDVEQRKKTPMLSYDDLLATVIRIASIINDGDEIEGEIHEMSQAVAFDTATGAIALCRDTLKTDGSDLPPIAPGNIIGD